MVESITDKFNIMVIGDEEVGKTTILERYFERKFYSDRKKTIGVEHYLKDYRDDKTHLLYNLKFWDTAGQEKFRAITKHYYQRANGMIVVLAINKRSSLSNLKIWINSIIENSSSKIPLVVICNKCDLEDERAFQNTEVERVCYEENLKVYFTSAKSGVNIDEAFEHIINVIIKESQSKEIGLEDNKEKIKLDNTHNDSNSSSKCCS